MAVLDVPDPQIRGARDAVVKVTSTAICGSDLHLYDGYVPTMRKGDILGHEFMGEVVETGRSVSNLSVCDRVVVPFPIAYDRGKQAARMQTERLRSEHAGPGRTTAVRTFPANLLRDLQFSH